MATVKRFITKLLSGESQSRVLVPACMFADFHEQFLSPCFRLIGKFDLKR